MMRKLFVIALAVSVFCVLLAAPALADEAKKAEAKKPAMPAGQKVFTEAKCQMCHTVYSAGVGEPPAEDAKAEEEEAAAEAGPPDLSMAGADRTAEWISLFLQKKEALNDKMHMKSFKGSDEDLAALVDWLLTLKPAEEDAPKAEKTSDAAVEKAAEGGAAEKSEGEAAEKSEGGAAEKLEGEAAEKSEGGAAEKSEGEAAEKGDDCGSHDSSDKADEDAGTEAEKDE